MKIFEFPIYVDIDGRLEIVFPERYTWESINQMKRQMGSATFGNQNLLIVTSEADKKFKMEWLAFWEELPKNLKIVICNDPANTNKKRSDYTAMSVHGFDEYQNWYVLDLFRDKITTESARSTKLFELHKKWTPYAENLIPVLYETTGFQILDKNYTMRRQREFEYYFPIIEMGGGAMRTCSKMQRISSLQPFFERNIGIDSEKNIDKKLYLPRSCIHYSENERKNIDMLKEFLYEYEFFTPLNSHKHDDLLDTLSFVLYWEGFQNARATKSEVKEIIKPVALTWGDVIQEIEESYEIKW